VPTAAVQKQHPEPVLIGLQGAVTLIAIFNARARRVAAPARGASVNASSLAVSTSADRAAWLRAQQGGGSAGAACLRLTHLALLRQRQPDCRRHRSIMRLHVVRACHVSAAIPAPLLPRAAACAARVLAAWRDVRAPQMLRRREPGCVWVDEAQSSAATCSVCHDVLTDPVSLACGHSFCRACAVRWFTSSAKLCPECRRPDTAGSNPASLPTELRLRDIVEALRMHCRFGLREDERGAWIPDPAGCQAQLRRDEVTAHEAVCEHAPEACPFAGCGVVRRRRDADAHDAEMERAHARGERSARLALEATTLAQQARIDAQQACLDAQKARQDALESRQDAHEVWKRSVVLAESGGGAATGAVHCATLNAHTGDVHACDWSPDSSMLVSGGFDGQLKLWDVATRECTATLNVAGEDGVISDCVWSPDGCILACARTDAKLQLWDVATQTCLASLQRTDGAGDGAESCAWSPDGHSLAITRPDGFEVWDVLTGRRTARHAGCFVSCAWSPSGRKVLIVGAAVALWDVARRSCAPLAGHAEVRACAWKRPYCRSGPAFLTASDDTTLKLWPAAEPFTRAVLLRGHSDKVRSCAWSLGGSTIVSGSNDGMLKLWDAASGQCRDTLSCEAVPSKCCWSPDGDAFAVGCDDGMLELYNVHYA
jgi:hypothetical protein